MDNIIYDGTIYERLFRQENYILKYSRQSVDAWEALANKNLPFLNMPISYFKLSSIEKLKYNSISKIYLPYLTGYNTLYGNDSKIESKDILLLLKKLLEYVKVMHENNVYHGDMFSQNIMINDNQDVSLIDLDASIIDNFISDENVYFEDDASIEDKKHMTMTDDKLGIFNLFLYYFINGNFNVGVDYELDLKKLGLNEKLTKEIMYLSQGNVDYNYYFLDIVDEFLSIGYEKRL